VARPIGGLFASIGNLADLRQQNQELQAEVERLGAEVGRSRALAAENAELRAHLELPSSWVTMERVTAQVIADAPGNYRWAVVIDKGSEAGIRRDMAVIEPSGLVGKVIRVQARQATVLLLIDPSAGAAATIEGKNVTGAVSGNGADQPLSLEFIPKDAGVAVGDLVLTSNLNRGIFPPGITIGTVAAVEGDERVSEFDISVQPAVNLEALGFVEVLLATGTRPQGLASP
jgi:rod shape-determining protein MreC